MHFEEIDFLVFRFVQLQRQACRQVTLATLSIRPLEMGEQLQNIPFIVIEKDKLKSFGTSKNLCLLFALFLIKGRSPYTEKLEILVYFLSQRK